MIPTSRPLLKRPLKERTASHPHPRMNGRIWLILMAFCGFGMGGCSAVHTPADYPHTQAESALIPPSATVLMNDGVRIPLRLYRPTGTPRALILALHGFGDSRDAWETLAPRLTHAGVEIVAPDLRGFGQAPASLGWSSTARLLQDTKSELDWLHQRSPGVPVYVMGESMGGALAYLWAAQNAASSAAASQNVQGVILLAPAIVQIGQPAISLLALWNMFTPGMVLTAEDAPGHRLATKNYRAMRRLFFDPLTTRSATVHALHGLVTLMNQASIAPAPRLPVLFIWGDHDQFVPAAATTHFLRRHASSALPSLTMRLDELDGGYHLLSREPDRVGTDVLSWLFTPDQFLPSGGDMAAAAWMGSH